MAFTATVVGGFYVGRTPAALAADILAADCPACAYATVAGYLYRSGAGSKAMRLIAALRRKGISVRHTCGV